MRCGHAEQVASNVTKGVLLRCPRCGWLYLDPSNGLSDPHHIVAGTALSWFGLSS